MYERRNKKIIDEVNATMRLEGMPLTVDDKEMIRRCLEGESSFDVERQRILKEVALLNG